MLLSFSKSPGVITSASIESRKSPSFYPRFVFIRRAWFFLACFGYSTFLRISIDGRDRVHTSMPSPPNPLDQNSCLANHGCLAVRFHLNSNQARPAISSRQTGEACGFFNCLAPKVQRIPDSDGSGSRRPRRSRPHQGVNSRASATTRCRNTIPSRRQSGESVETLLPPEPRPQPFGNRPGGFPRTPPHDRSKPVEDGVRPASPANSLSSFCIALVIISRSPSV